MARIRGKDTRPELKLRKALWAAGLRYRLSVKLPGRPDLVFPGKKVALFVDGCFWHGCPLHYSAPKTRFEFWATKLKDNITRDQRVDAELAQIGWSVVHVWQHDLRCLEKVVKNITEILDERESSTGKNFDARPQTVMAAEPSETYRAAWFTCDCGGTDVQVVAVEGSGSLRPKTGNRPERVEIACRQCHARFRRIPR
jgi:DNA mismatch endonuclease (patch repair protein)